MASRYIAGALLFLTGLAAQSAFGIAGDRSLTPEEIRRAVVGHTWTAPASGRPTVMSSAESELYKKLKSKGSGQFWEYYAPDGSIQGAVRRSDFDARVEGRWRISGSQFCASYSTTRTWKAEPLRATARANWCYSFVYKGSSLMMAVSRAPSGGAGSIGEYFRPKLTTGNSVP